MKVNCLLWLCATLNMNNEVFGFYNGRPQYVLQREYYKPSYAVGFRYVLARENN